MYLVLKGRLLLSFLMEKIFSEVRLLPDPNPNEPLGELVRAWLPTKLLVDAGVAGVTAEGINWFPAACALLQSPICR